MSRVAVISWIQFHGRSAALASALQADAIFIHTKGGPLRRYVAQYRATLRDLAQADYDAVIVMLPPVVAMAAVVQWASRRSNVQLWADLHTGVFENPRWKWARGLTFAIIKRYFTGAIVTNRSLADRLIDKNVQNVVILDDILQPSESKAPGGSVVFPVAYANDEPIGNIIEAARLIPEISFVLTGRAPQSVKDSAPPNVHFPGFVSRIEFDKIIREATAIGALTNRPFTMQRAGYEALELSVPLLTSPTDDLRRYFGDCVEYTDAQNSAKSIAMAIDKLVSNHDSYARRMHELRSSKIREQTARLHQLRTQLSLSGNNE